jgi:hypothetical protein
MVSTGSGPKELPGRYPRELQIKLVASSRKANLSRKAASVCTGSLLFGRFSKAEPRNEPFSATAFAPARARTILAVQHPTRFSIRIHSGYSPEAGLSQTVARAAARVGSGVPSTHAVDD